MAEKARSPSGKARVCKILTTGSIPVRASNFGFWQQNPFFASNGAHRVPPRGETMAAKQSNSQETITPRARDYGQWYLDVVKNGDLADHSSVRG